MSAEDDFWAGEAQDEDDATVRVEVASLREGAARTFPFVRRGEPSTGIVVRWQGEVHVYVNRCPHIRLSLDYGDGRLWAPGEQAFLCTMHGAQFAPDTGRCFVGPPRGRSLERLPYDVDGDWIVVHIVPEPEGWPRTPSE